MQIQQGAHDIEAVCIFQHITGSAGFYAVEHIVLVAGSRDDHDIAGGMAMRAVTDNVDAGTIGQTQVDQQEFHRLLLQPAQCGFHIAERIKQFQRWLFLDCKTQGAARQRIILDD